MNNSTLTSGELRSQQRKILISASLLCFLSGMFYMWSILSQAMVQGLGWSSSQASLPYTVYTLAFALAMTVFGKVQDEKGPRFVVIVGAVLMGVGLILSGLILNPLSMVLTSGVITGLGIGMINSAVVAPALKWHPADKNGFVTGIILGGTGFSPVLYSPLGEYLIDSAGLANTFLIIGIVSLIPSLFLAKYIVNPKEQLFKVDEQEAQGKQYTWQEMLRDPNSYKLWFMYAFAATAGLMIISHASTIAAVQVGWEGGMFLVIILAVFNTLGRIIGGIGSDKIGRLNFLRIVLLIQLINMVLFNFYSSKATIMIGSLVGGFCYGSNFSIFPAFVADLYGREHYGVNYGIIYTAWGVGGVIGPMVAATIFDNTGVYFTAYKISAALLVIAMVISMTFKMPKNKLQRPA